MKKFYTVCLLILSFQGYSQQGTIESRDDLKQAFLELFQARKYAESREFMENQIKRDLPPDMLFFAYGQLITNHLFFGDFNSSMRYIQLGDSLLDKHEFDKIDEVEYHFASGQAFWSMARYDEARNSLENARRILLEEDSLHRLDAIVFLLGNLAFNNGDYVRAIRIYIEAIEVCLQTRGKAHPFIAGIYGNIGESYGQNGQFEKAIEYYNQNINHIIEVMGLQQADATLLIPYTNIGSYYSRIGKYNQAIRYQSKALDIALTTEGQSAVLLPEVYLNLGGQYVELNRYDSAKLFYDQSYLELEKRGFADKEVLFRYLIDVGGWYLSTGNHERAGSSFRRALKHFRENELGDYRREANIFYLLGSAELAKGDISRGHTLADSAIAKMPSLALTDWKQAVEPLKMSLPFQDYDNAVELMRLKAQLHESAYKESNGHQDLERAFQYYSHSLHFLKNLANEALGVNELPHYYKSRYPEVLQAMLNAAFNLNKNSSDTHYLKEAFVAADLARSNLLRTQFAMRSLGADTLVDKSLVDSLRETRRLIFETNYRIEKAAGNPDSLKNRLFTLNRLSETLVDSLEFDASGYRPGLTSNSEDIFEQVQGILKEDELLLSYSRFEDQLFIFSLDRNTIDLHQQPLGDEFSQAFNELRSAVNPQMVSAQPKTTSSGFYGAIGTLSELLLSPLKDKSDDIEKLIVIPDQEVFMIPFSHLLLGEYTPSTHPQDLPLLLKKYSTTMIFGSDQLLNPGVGSENGLPNSALSFAPSYVSGSSKTKERVFQPLQWSEEESKSFIDRIAFAESVQAGEMETRFKEKAESTGVIHVAAHAIADDSSPLSSFIAFGNDSSKYDDNMLYAYEIFGMDMNTRLLILSACETASGEYLTGEGLISLAYAFQYAGVESLQATQWEVDDESTFILLQSYFEELASGVSSSEAMQRAQLHYLETAPEEKLNPFFWAGFVNFGKDVVVVKKEFDTIRYLALFVVLILIVIVVFRIRKKAL